VSGLLLTLRVYFLNGQYLKIKHNCAYKYRNGTGAKPTETLKARKKRRVSWLAKRCVGRHELSTRGAVTDWLKAHQRASRASLCQEGVRLNESW
jgi:hypothetical protein